GQSNQCGSHLRGAIPSRDILGGGCHFEGCDFLLQVTKSCQWRHRIATTLKDSFTFLRREPTEHATRGTRSTNNFCAFCASSWSNWLCTKSSPCRDLKSSLRSLRISVISA